MEFYTNLRYCPSCLGNDYISKEELSAPKMSTPTSIMRHYVIYKGIVADHYRKKCPTCNGELIEMNLTIKEWITLQYNSTNQDFIFAMDKLKQDDIIEFTSRMTQFEEIEKQRFLEISRSKMPKQNIPKCPTCGSTNIKKISATKRWVSTGILGLGSSDLGKTMCCESCGAKW